MSPKPQILCPQKLVMSRELSSNAGHARVRLSLQQEKDLIEAGNLRLYEGYSFEEILTALLSRRRSLLSPALKRVANARGEVQFSIKRTLAWRMLGREAFLKWIAFLGGTPALLIYVMFTLAVALVLFLGLFQLVPDAPPAVAKVAGASLD